jgi:hypothetical protein
MRFFGGLRRSLAGLVCGVVAAAAFAQTTAPTPAPASPASAAPLRLTEPPVLSVSRLPADNPFGTIAETPAALPAKPPFAEITLSVPFYASLRLDRAGKVLESRRVRDPIPSLSADSKRSFDRWSFDPARKAGQPVESWANVRIDLQVEVRTPRIEQISLSPVTPSTPIPAPLDWASDSVWYDSLQKAAPSDGTVPTEQLDILPVPKKTKWDADSYKGPFSCRFWVRVGPTGRIEKSVPIQASDPVLIAYMRRQMSAWQLQPARQKGQPVATWNELLLAGQIGYSTQIKQIANLRKTLFGS